MGVRAERASRVTSEKERKGKKERVRASGSPLNANFRCYDKYRLAGVPTWHATSDFPIGGSLRSTRSERFSQMTRVTRSNEPPSFLVVF